MKKIIALLLSVTLFVCLTGCGISALPDVGDPVLPSLSTVCTKQTVTSILPARRGIQRPLCSGKWLVNIGGLLKSAP